MAAEKFDYSYEDEYGTYDVFVIQNQTKNGGYVYNVHFKVDYNDETEAMYGLSDYKGHYVFNHEQYNDIFKVDGEKPWHFNENMWDM